MPVRVIGFDALLGGGGLKNTKYMKKVKKIYDDV